jgi:cytoskeletal protein CcmA (bactofilin family)
MRILFWISVISLFCAVSPLAKAQMQFETGNDLFLSGSAPIHNTENVDDLFMSGDTLRSEVPISGSAHLAGRSIVIDEVVGGDVYAAAMDVSINAPVTGDVTAFGYSVTVEDVGGDLIASGNSVSLSGVVTGYSIINGGNVSFNSVVKGDVSLTAQQVEFSETALIEGKLIVFEDREGATQIPDTVVPEDRIERRPASGTSYAAEELPAWDGDHPIMQFVTRFLFVAIFVALIAAFTPRTSEKLREGAGRRPWSALLLGFIALSAAIGAAIVLMITGIGFFLVPIPLLIAFVGALAGYLLGVYLAGTGVLSLLGRTGQEKLSSRLLAAGTGALAATIISRLPFLGWLGTLTITLIGLGVLAVWLFRPKFFVAN